MRRPIKLQTYHVVARAVEEGMAYGLQRYNKYNNDALLDVDVVTEHLKREVMNALCEVIDFPD